MYKTFLLVDNWTIKGAALTSLAQSAAGSDEFGQINFTGAVVDGDNFSFLTGQWTGRAHYEFNTDVLNQTGLKYWLKLLGSSSLTLGDASLNNTTTGVVRGVTITAHGFSLGYVFAVGTENFRVINVRDVNTVDVYRGYAGSTVAAHASGASVLTLANYTGIDLAHDCVIPVTALAIATAGPEIATAMVALDGFKAKDYASIASGVLKQTSLGYGFDWEYDSTNTRLFFHRPCRGNAPGSTTIAITGNITNATVQGLYGGVQVAEVKSTVESRVPTSAEVTAGIMDFAFPWPVKSWQVLGDVTSTEGVATIGATVSFSADKRRLTLTNNGTNNFATTDTVTVKVTG